MRHVETLPAWAQRFKHRAQQRHSDDRIVRWIALPDPKARAGARALGGPEAHCGSSNDNVEAIETRAAS